MGYTKWLDSYFKDRTAQDLFSGVVLVTRGETALYQGAFGYANRTWKIPNDHHVLFDTASITKMFTAVAALQMVEQEAFDLDTSVVDYLDLYGSAISTGVNVFHLLTHTSGIGDDVEEEDGELYEDLWQERPNYRVTETHDFLAQFIHKPPNFEPGESCRYCNCSFILLGLMVEKAAGMSYRDYVREFVFKPAGMTTSNFFHMGIVNENVAEGADPIRDEKGHVVGWKRNLYAFPPVGSPDSGAHVTAVDLDRFLRAVKDGKLLSSRLTKDFFTPQVLYRDHDDWTQMYGYGMWFFVDENQRVVCCQKEGINAGVSGLVRYFPDQDINLVILSNMECGAWEPVWEIHEMVVTGEIG